MDLFPAATPGNEFACYDTVPENRIRRIFRDAWAPEILTVAILEFAQ